MIFGIGNSDYLYWNLLFFVREVRFCYIRFFIFIIKYLKKDLEWKGFY